MTFLFQPPRLLIIKESFQPKQFFLKQYTYADYFAIA